MRDLVRDVLEKVDRPDHSDAVVGQVDPLGDVGDDVDALAWVLVDAEITRRLVVRRAEVEAGQTLPLRPGEGEALHVGVVELDGVTLDPAVGDQLRLGVLGVDSLKIQALGEVKERCGLVHPAHQVLVVEDRPGRVVTPDGIVDGSSETIARD